MNEIEQYRKASAEWMGFKIEDNPLLGKVYRKYNIEFIIKVKDWKPNLKENAHQMGMIEDKLIEEGYGITYAKWPDDSFWYVHLWGKEKVSKQIALGRNKSKSIAFMKAFMSYLDSQ